MIVKWRLAIEDPLLLALRVWTRPCSAQACSATVTVLGSKFNLKKVKRSGTLYRAFSQYMAGRQFEMSHNIYLIRLQILMDAGGNSCKRCNEKFTFLSTKLKLIYVNIYY